MSLDKLFEPESIFMICGGSGKVRKDPTASYNEITEEIKQNSLRPGFLLLFLPIRCDNLKGASIEDPLQLG